MSFKTFITTLQLPDSNTLRRYLHDLKKNVMILKCLHRETQEVEDLYERLQEPSVPTEHISSSLCMKLAPLCGNNIE